MPRFWRVPGPHWQDETVFIVGGGPSLKGLDLSVLDGRRTIAVNNAFRIVPNPSVIFYADTRWWRWNGADISVNTPARLITTSSAGVKFLSPRVVRMNRDYRFEAKPPVAISDDPSALSGPDSGYMAINLAYLFGASRIVLLGFDMGFTAGAAHWHEDHPVASQETDYVDRFLPVYPALVDILKKRGVEVIRCTPSRLSFIPELSLSEALSLPKRQRG